MMEKNVLSASGTIISASPIHKATEIPIFISPDSADRDVYETGNNIKLPSDWATRARLTEEETAKWKKKYAQAKGWISPVALTGQGLARIFSAIDATTIKNGPGDMAVGPFMCHWAFEASYTQSDGSRGILSGDYLLDLRLPEDVGGPGARYQEIFNNQREKLLLDFAKVKKLKRAEGKPFEDYKEDIWFSLTDEEKEDIERVASYRAHNAVVKRRPFIVQLAQTGAKNRAIRALGVKSWYFPHELEHPLIVQRMKFDWDSASSLLGQNNTNALLWGLVEKQFGVAPPTPIQITAGNVPQQKNELYVEADFTEEMIERKEVVDDFSRLGFNAPYVELKGEPGVKKQIKDIMANLALVGYDDQEKRHGLLGELFPELEILDGYLIGHFSLLSGWARSVANGEDRDRMTAILRRGVELNRDWEYAKASIAVEENPELASELEQDEEVDF